ncbi:MAG: hypothetical protein ACYDEV_10890 [Acidiferrobacter sp.]
MKPFLCALALWAFGMGNALAFLGVGDITFDPPVHAELISLFDQTLAIYHTVLSEVRRMQAVEDTLKSAQRDVRVITNGGLARYENRALPVGIPLPIGAYLRTARRVVQTGSDLQGYYQQQARRFGRLSRLKWLARGTGKDVSLSATSLGVKTSGDVTAQSTATLATLASDRARATELRAIRRAAERRNDKHLPERAVTLYRAFGKTP